MKTSFWTKLVLIWFNSSFVNFDLVTFHTGNADVTGKSVQKHAKVQNY
jgi:hypothetical protein